MPRKRNPNRLANLVIGPYGVCRRCQTADASTSFFSPHPLFCAACYVEIAAKWNEFWAPIERSATFKRYKNQYGLTEKDYGALYELQGGCCAICRRFDRPLVVDHCHSTGLVRGLLCGHCNSAIGFLGDDPEVTMRACRYLEIAAEVRQRKVGACVEVGVDP